MNISPLQRAVDIAGNQSALARKINVKQAHVWYWLKTGSVPADHCIAIEKATNGRVTRYELRPKSFGPAPESEKAA